MNSFRLFLSEPAVPVFFPSLSLSHPPSRFSPSPLFLSFSLPIRYPCLLRVPSREVCTISAPRFLPYTVVLLSGPWLQRARFSPPTGEFLFIYGGLNEP